MSTQSTPTKNNTGELAKEGLGLMVTRRQMLVGGLVALGAMAVPTPLLDLVPGAKPREAQAAWSNTDLPTDRWFVIKPENDSNRYGADVYSLVCWSSSTDSYMRVGTFPVSKSGLDKFWQFERISGNLYYLRNAYNSWYLDLCNGDYNDGGSVGVYPWNGSTCQQWFVDQNNDYSRTFIIHEPDWVNYVDWCLDSTGTLGNSCTIWTQHYESGTLGSSNINQKWWLDYADYYFDVNGDHNDYGNYSAGGRVKSYDVKVTCYGRQTYQASGVEDYYRRDFVDSVYEITNVVYRDGYAYKDCDLSAGTLVYAAENGSAFTVKHTAWDDITFSINTQDAEKHKLEVTFDGDQYGKTYSEGARVKSLDVKITSNGKTAYNKTGLEDYEGEAVVGSVYEITNVKYRDEYVFAGCTLSAGTIVSQAEDGSSFTICHSAREDITFDIQTKDAIIYPKGPTKSVKITS